MGPKGLPAYSSDASDTTLLEFSSAATWARIIPSYFGYYASIIEIPHKLVHSWILLPLVLETDAKPHVCLRINAYTKPGRGFVHVLTLFAMPTEGFEG